MSLFKKMARQRFEEKLRKNDDNFKRFEKYERGRDVKTTGKTKEELEGLGKIVKVIGDGFVEHTYKQFEFIGRLGSKDSDYFLINYRPKLDKKNRQIYDKEGNQVYEGIPAKIKGVE